MSEGSNVRLVRCPNCDNLITELLEYSVYQCGACSTILRAKKRDPESDVGSEKSDEDKRFALSESSAEKDSESEGNWRRKDRAFTEQKSNSSNRGFQRPEKEETLGIGGEFDELRLERIARDTETDQWTRKEKSMRTRPRMDWSSVERGGSSFTGNGKRAPSFSYADVGPSSYNPNPFPAGVEHLERERAELLRKLDELKEQLSRSYPIPPENPSVIPPERDSHPPLVDRRSFYPPPPPPPPMHYQYHQSHVPIEYHHNTRHYPPESYFHSPACSCMTCYEQRLRVQRFQIAHPNPNMNPNLYMIGPQQGYTSPRIQARWPGEFESEKRVVVPSKKVGRHCLPFSGGAPFVACRNCFEPLELPRGKLRMSKNRRQRLRCGACSAVISLELENNRNLIVSDADDNDKGSLVISNDNVALENSGSIKADSEELNKNSSFNFRGSLEEQDEKLSSDETETNNKKKDKKVFSSSLSASSSREELSFSSGIAREEDTRETVEFPVPPRSPMWQEPGSPRRAVNGDENFDRVNYREAEATELDVSFDEYQHMSQDYPESSREDYSSRTVQSGGKGNGDSFFVGFIKKSLRDFSKSSHGSVESEKPRVSVNGNPLRDRLVKSAEMYAGPIRPGDYWYDYKAGFWGVMGQSCLGIIPPGIEEFNYPMPTNCGAGDTGVYVNGRELNQRDLDLLANRGLPTEKDRFYVIEITGKVFDEATGEFVHNLGKLAPTVERAKHGFGMKVPRSIQ